MGGQSGIGRDLGGAAIENEQKACGAPESRMTADVWNAAKDLRENRRARRAATTKTACERRRLEKGVAWARHTRPQRRRCIDAPARVRAHAGMMSHATVSLLRRALRGQRDQLASARPHRIYLLSEPSFCALRSPATA